MLGYFILFFFGGGGVENILGARVNLICLHGVDFLLAI